MADPETRRLAGVTLTHPDKVLYPEQAVSKFELAQYYQDISKQILRYVENRPLTLVRCPDGRHKTCFFQKHVKDSAPETLGSVSIPEKGGKRGPYFVVRKLSGLIALVQMGVLELHVWGARADRLERPDLLVFDIDPDPELGWPEVIAAARKVRDRARELDLESWVKTTGGKGLHVVIPLVRRHEWDESSAFARALAESIASEDRKRYTINSRKDQRRGKIFIDYLRNSRGATSVAAYSPRARPGAPVSVPIDWEELGEDTRSDTYDIRNVSRRLQGLKRDPWKGFWSARQSISRAALRELKVA